MNNKINRLHERAFRIAYKDYSSSFATLLEKDRSVIILEKNMQLLIYAVVVLQHSIVILEKLNWQAH